VTFDIQKGGENRTVGWVTRGCKNAGNNYDFTGSGEEQLLTRQLLLSSFWKRESAEVGELCTGPEKVVRF